MRADERSDEVDPFVEDAALELVVRGAGLDIFGGDGVVAAEEVEVGFAGVEGEVVAAGWEAAVAGIASVTACWRHWGGWLSYWLRI